MDLITYLKYEKELTDQALGNYLNQVVYYTQQIDEDYSLIAKEIRRLALRGGKRLRPLLVRLSYQLTRAQEPSFDLVKLSLYVELMHLFVLTHDDIADRDLQRYGGPTLEKTFQREFSKRFGHTNQHFGTSMSIIAGDVLHIMANQLLCQVDLPLHKKLALLQEMQHILHRVVAGWNTHFWQNHVPIAQATRSRYLKGMELVSASYTVQGPLAIGQILATTRDNYHNPLQKFGYYVGMGFQIQDDILGVFGDSTTTGKPSGNDLREGKKTLLVLEAYNQATASAKKFMEAEVGNQDLSNQALDQLREIITQTGALEASKQHARKHIQQALEILDNLEGVNPQPQQRLQELAEFVVKREY